MNDQNEVPKQSAPRKRKRAGRKPWIPEPHERTAAIRMATLGIPLYQIAYVLGRSVRLIRKNFLPEMLKASIEANAKVTQTLFSLATDAKHPQAVIFWARTRCGFKFDEPALADLLPPPPLPAPANPQPATPAEHQLIFTDMEGNRVA